MPDAINYQKAKFIASYGNAAKIPESTCPEVCFVGRSNVGKSSIMNKLFNRKNLVKVSSTPGKTSNVNFFEADGVHFVDLPGYGFAQRSKAERGRWARLIGDFFESERSFNTAAPLQISVSQEGELHVRFYSPRDVEGILVTALIPSVCEEYIDLAYFDRIPAFADFKEAMPCLQREGYYRSASGKIVRIPKMDLSGLDGISFKAESDDPYWKKLQEIRHGWNIRFDLFGGDPTREDGGPSGNWMGIRPVHCREAVALFLNFTYMIDMPEHERILAENEDRLYGNGGVNDKVSAETVLKQMRQERTINVGLVYPGNGVMGLGGGSTFGAWQGGWLDHYSSTYACEVMFHELGHVMGYNHSSSFTYGPWAQELMNNFYVTHLSRMPVDSPKYLDSGNNPNIYL